MVWLAFQSYTETTFEWDDLAHSPHGGEFWSAISLAFHYLEVSCEMPNVCWVTLWLDLATLWR